MDIAFQCLGDNNQKKTSSATFEEDTFVFVFLFMCKSPDIYISNQPKFVVSICLIEIKSLFYNFSKKTSFAAN